MENGQDALPAIDDAYLRARFEVYRAVTAFDLDAAVTAAGEAIASATAVHERVDATLDRLYALFCSGRWSDARAVALDALLLVDRTQGDRAAGGILGAGRASGGVRKGIPGLWRAKRYWLLTTKR